jgi:hypothetical protein
MKHYLRHNYTHKGPPACLLLVPEHWGLGSQFNNMFLYLSVLIHFDPQPQLYYDHSTSPYQCPGYNGSLAPFLRPSEDLLKIFSPPRDCRKFRFMHGGGGIFFGPRPWSEQVPEQVISWNPDLKLSEELSNNLAHQQDIQVRR